jgi:uncharacterized protein (DUF433 family)
MSNALMTTAPSSGGTLTDLSTRSSAGPAARIVESSSHSSPVSGVRVQPTPVDRELARRRRILRSKPPKDSKVYKTVMAIVALRAQGQHTSEIAEQLGLKHDTILTYIKRANQRGWIGMASFADPEDKLKYVIQDKIVSNVHTVLGERTEDGALTGGAREMTIEAAKGLGLFKQHQVVKGDVNATIGMALKVEVLLPSAVQDSRITIRPGTVGGTPGVMVPADAEIIDNEE